MFRRDPRATTKASNRVWYGTPAESTLAGTRATSRSRLFLHQGRSAVALPTIRRHVVGQKQDGYCPTCPRGRGPVEHQSNAGTSIVRWAHKAVARHRIPTNPLDLI